MNTRQHSLLLLSVTSCTLLNSMWSCVFYGLKLREISGISCWYDLNRCQSKIHIANTWSLSDAYWMSYIPLSSRYLLENIELWVFPSNQVLLFSEHYEFGSAFTIFIVGFLVIIYSITCSFHCSLVVMNDLTNATNAPWIQTSKLSFYDLNKASPSFTRNLSHIIHYTNVTLTFIFGI